MTIREWLTKHLTDNGLWPDEAASVLDTITTAAAVQGSHAATIAEIFGKQAEGYPSQMFAVLMMSVNQFAVEWIDANKPKHFARPMFLPADERRAILVD